jgi:hypothetical protein
LSASAFLRIFSGSFETSSENYFDPAHTEGTPARCLSFTLAAAAGSVVMRIWEDDGHDIGTILVTVILTLVVGAGIYAYSRTPSVQTAFGPVIEKTVPTIVPNSPQF